MTEPYLERLCAFSRILRQEGLDAGPAQTADAARVLLLLGMEDRERVKTAMRTVYSKSREEQLIFDRCFDGFFLPQDVIEAKLRKQREEQVRLEQQSREAEKELQLNGQPMDFSPEQRSAYAAMVSVGLDFISALIQWQLVQSQRDSGQPPQEPITS